MKLKEYIEKNDIIISELARELDMTKWHLFAIVSGRRRPGIHLCRRIEQATKGQVTLDDLVEREGPTNRCPTCGKIWRTGVKIEH